MFIAQINAKSAIKLEKGKGQDSWIIDGKELQIDKLDLDSNSIHVLLDRKSFRVQLLSADKKTKTYSFKINNQTYNVNLKDKYDDLLQKLGMDASASKKVNELKAPMPGLVVDIFVNNGQEIKKGDALLVLEAMKMENILKSNADGTIKKVEVKKGSTVEKNEVLIHFE